jgi:hypothetical protein
MRLPRATFKAHKCARAIIVAASVEMEVQVPIRVALYWRKCAESRNVRHRTGIGGKYLYGRFRQVWMRSLTGSKSRTQTAKTQSQIKKKPGTGDSHLTYLLSDFY